MVRGIGKGGVGVGAMETGMVRSAGSIVLKTPAMQISRYLLGYNLGRLKSAEVTLSLDFSDFNLDEFSHPP